MEARENHEIKEVGQQHPISIYPDKDLFDGMDPGTYLFTHSYRRLQKAIERIEDVGQAIDDNRDAKTTGELDIETLNETVWEATEVMREELDGLKTLMGTYGVTVGEKPKLQ